VTSEIDRWGYAGDGGPASEALFCQTWDSAIDAAGNLFVADTNNNRIRRIDAQTGIVTTVVGSGPVNGYEHYGQNGSGAYAGDGGPALAARLNTPLGVAFDRDGNLFIADNGNGRIRNVDRNGIITTFAEMTTTKLVFDSSGRLYATGGIACGTSVIRFDRDGKSTRLGGSDLQGFSGDGGPALQAQMRATSQATGVAIDAEGNVFFVDSGNYRIRAIRYGALLSLPAITMQPMSPRVTEGQSATFAVAATGFPTPAFQWQKNGANISGATGASYTITSAQSTDAANYTVVVTNLLGNATSGTAALTIVSGPTPPSIAAPPVSQTVDAGTTAPFTVLVNGSPPLSYQWQKNGTVIVGAMSASYNIMSAQPTDAGSYTCVVTNAAGNVTSAAATLTVNGARLTSLSVRSGAGTGDKTLILGFYVGGAGSKHVLIRGIGPTLAQFGVGGALADPQLKLFNVAGSLIDQNNDWGGSAVLVSAFASVNDFALPANSTDAALLVTLPPDGYTAQVNGAGTSTGIALIEAYDADTGMPGARFTALSARNQVGTGDNILIAGFVVTGNVPKTLLIRGIGPTLANYGVSGVLADPQLALYRLGEATPLQQNNDWGGTADLSNAFAATQAFPLPTTSRDAAMLVTLSPGSYTAQVSGVGGTTGVALVEVYEMP
jgi:hypothetical protein